MNPVTVHDNEPDLDDIPEWSDVPSKPIAPKPRPIASVPSVPVSVALPVLSRAAYHGLAGEFLDALHGKTEAHPAALLVTLLAGVGNMIGDPAAMGGHPVYDVQNTEHGPRIFAVFVGTTSQGAKGLSIGTPMAILQTLDPTWFDERVQTGLSTGEGLIYAIRDGDNLNPSDARHDPGVSDKRLFFELQEFGRLLAVKERQNNTLSGVLREAWDGDRPLGNLTKHIPMKASRPYVSGVAHVTPEELTSGLTAIDQANGFANRFLWIYTYRVMSVPNPVKFPLTHPVVKGLRDVLAWTKTLDDYHMGWTEAGKAAWESVYEDLLQVPGGFMGAMMGRARPQVIRLAMIYALLDRTLLIGPEHLAAALAVWDYSKASLGVIYRSPTGNPHADKILDYLKVHGSILRNHAYDSLFRKGKDARADDLDEAVQILVSRFGVVVTKEKGSGHKPAERWTLPG